jgi:hypothetical protein
MYGKGREAMGKIRKPTGRAVSMPAGIAWGAAVSYAVTLVCGAIAAWLMDHEIIELEAVGYGAMVILLLASALGALTARVLVKHRILPVCAATGGVYIAMLLATTAAFFGGRYSGVGVTVALVMAGALSVGLLGQGRKGTITRRNIKLKTG